MHILQIGQWNERNSFNTLHCGHESIGLYKYPRYCIAYFVFEEAYYKLIAPGDRRAVII